MWFAILSSIGGLESVWDLALLQVSEEAIKKDDPVVPDDAGANKEEAVEEETQEQAGEIEGEEAPAAVRRRTRRDT